MSNSETKTADLEAHARGLADRHGPAILARIEAGATFSEAFADAARFEMAECKRLLSDPKELRGVSDSVWNKANA